MLPTPLTQKKCLSENKAEKSLLCDVIGTRLAASQPASQPASSPPSKRILSGNLVGQSFDPISRFVFPRLSRAKSDKTPSPANLLIRSGNSRPNAAPRETVD